MNTFLSLAILEDDFFYASSSQDHFSIRCVSKPNVPLSVSVILINPPEKLTQLVSGKIVDMQLRYGDASLHVSLRIRTVCEQVRPPNRTVFLEMGNEQMIFPVSYRTFQNIYASSLFGLLIKKYGNIVHLAHDPLLTSFCVSNPIVALQSLACRTRSLIAFAPQSISVVPRRPYLEIPPATFLAKQALHMQTKPTSLLVTTDPQLQWQILQPLFAGFWIHSVTHLISSHPRLGRSVTTLQVRLSR